MPDHSPTPLTRRQLFAAFSGLLASLFVPTRKRRDQSRKAWLSNRPQTVNHDDDGQLVRVRDANQIVQLANMDRPPRLLAGREAEMMDLRGRIYLHGVRVYRRRLNA